MRKELIRVSLNGIGGFEHNVVSADSIEGWIEVMDNHRRYPGGSLRILTEMATKRTVISRRLYGDVRITYRGQPLLRASAKT